ncbi:MAG: tyrosine--tRNA ligase, partial [Planctomycetota bacterium]
MLLNFGKIREKDFFQPSEGLKTMNPYKILKERGFYQRETHPNDHAVEKLFEKEKVKAYIGFDGTAPSLHVGSLMGIMALSHLQREGHTPIVLIGGATTLVGDPSGKQELRKMLPEEEVEQNSQAIQKQIEHFLGKENVIYENNFNWLGKMGLIPFLREVGPRFTIAEMLTTESYKTRLEKGLTFLEFTYQLFQAYDFLHLYRTYQCKLQMGGDDQWGNICAGVDLVRKIEGAQVEGLTYPLLTTASGTKMGKTEKGALWLDGNLTPPYDFYQYWINVDDRDVGRLLRFYTYLPLEEIQKLEQLEGADIRKAKEVLAFEITKLVHGKEEAEKAKKAAKALFYGGASKEGVPTIEVEIKRLEEGIPLLDAFLEAGLIKSKSEGRRKLKEGGIY